MSDYQEVVAKMYESNPKLTDPDPLDALASNLLDLGYGISAGYVRNNPERHENPEDNIVLEIGQVLMMLAALANGLGLDLDVCFCRAIERMCEVHGGTDG